MARRDISGLALAAVGIGSVFVYGGVTGRSPLVTVQGLIRGQAPNTAGQTSPITPPPAAPAASSSGGSSGSGTGGPATATQPSAFAFIAAQAQSYVGAGYEWAGAPAKGPGHWDCSSFVNWIVGFRAGLPIPGYSAGHYDGTVHGPIALEWYAWSGATTIGHDGDAAQPGDLACWQTHMGICIGGGMMVSARSASDHPPTGINRINGDIPGELLAIRRLKGV